MKALRSFYNRILIVVLSAIGFSSCIDDSGDEYGCPHADYKIKGTILNEDSEPIENVRIYEIRHYGPFPIQKNDTTYTKEYFEGKNVRTQSDEDGKFEFLNSNQNQAMGNKEVLVHFLHNDYTQVDTIFDFNDVELTGGKGWYEGCATIDTEIIMKKKE